MFNLDNKKSKRVLILYAGKGGHYLASVAIENALKKLGEEIETLNVDYLSYINPTVKRIIKQSYIGIVKNTPAIWNYLYDNQKIIKFTNKIVESVNKRNARKLFSLLLDFDPDAVVCTQAVPCALIASYKKRFSLEFMLFGVLTDFAPHSYWLHEGIDYFIVPSDDIYKKMSLKGVPEDKIMPFGIPIDLKFSEIVDKDILYNELGFSKSAPVILIMGGSLGLEPIKSAVKSALKSKLNIQLLIVAGTNKKLYNWAKKIKFPNNQKARIFTFTEKINKLMSISSAIITKAGGITIAEALSKQLPIIISKPLPGQERMNTRFLLKEGLAFKANSNKHLVVILKDILENEDKLKKIKDKYKNYSKPDAALKIANLILSNIDRLKKTEEALIKINGWSNF